MINMVIYMTYRRFASNRGVLQDLINYIRKIGFVDLGSLYARENFNIKNTEIVFYSLKQFGYSLVHIEINKKFFNEQYDQEQYAID